MKTPSVGIPVLDLGTVVSRDKSMEALVDNGEKWIPSLKFVITSKRRPQR